MFDRDEFINDCRNALKEGTGAQAAIRDVLTRAVADPAAVLRDLGEPDRAGVDTIHHSEDLTIINVVWGRYMTIMPHNHEMWANIGVYTGREDNIFWRRVPDAQDGLIEAAGAKSLGCRDATTLGRDIIHSVTNPIGKLTAAIHVYGGNFFETPRSEWDPESHCEHPYNVEKNMQLFEKANAA